jgi:hypothetical protein
VMMILLHWDLDVSMLKKSLSFATKIDI